MNMYAKVLVSLLVTALAPLVIVLSITYHSNKETLVGMVGDSLESSALTLARTTTLLVQSGVQEVESWSKLDTLQGVFTGEDIDLRMGLLLRDLQANSDFIEIQCTDTTGRVLAASDFNRVARDASAELGVKVGLRGEIYVSSVQARSVGGETRDTVIVAFPIIGAFDEETLIGVLVAYYDWQQVQERIAFQESSSSDEEMALLLLDNQHKIVAQGPVGADMLGLLAEELTLLAGNGNESLRFHRVSSVRGRKGRQIVGVAMAQGDYPQTTYTGVAIAPEELVLQPVRRQAWFTLLLCLFAVVAILLVALVLSRRISRPLTALSATARRIASGDLDISPPKTTQDEIGLLAEDLDVMRRSLKTQIDTLDSSVRERTQQLEETVTKLQGEILMREQAQRDATLREQQLRQADKMVSLGTLVSGVAHEINNPNGLIALNLGILKEVWEKALPVLEAYHEEYGDFSLGSMSYTELREHMPLLLKDAMQSSDRISGIVDDLKGFSRKSDERLDDKVALNDVVESVLSLLAGHLKKATRRLEVDLSGDAPLVRGNRQRLEQVLINLFLNACDALEATDQAIAVRTCTQGADSVCIEIRDEGRGIASQHLPHVTDPFFTTRRNDGGTGLGLSISAGIIEEHCGQLSFESEKGVGTVARIILPRIDAGEVE